MNTRVKNLAHDKAFANVYILDTDISRLKQEIKDDNTPFITIDQLEGVLRHTKQQREVWDYIAKLIEIDHEKIDYLDYEKQNTIQMKLQTWLAYAVSLLQAQHIPRKRGLNFAITHHPHPSASADEHDPKVTTCSFFEPLKSIFHVTPRSSQ